MEKKEVVKSGKYYVYVHRRNDNNEIFYVGKGVGKRAWIKNREYNEHWTRVVNKHGYSVEIVQLFDTETEAYEFERSLIAEIGLDNLVNICEGGEGGPTLEGEENGRFGGFTFIFSDEEKLVIVADGTKLIEDAGFNWPTVCEMKNHQKSDYITSKKIHKNGVKIRFNRVIQSNDDAFLEEINNSGYIFISPEDLGEEICGQKGENCPNFKGYSIGYNEKQIAILSGNKEMEENDFNPGHVGTVISGERKTHAKMKWYRVKNLSEIPQEHRILEPFNEPTKQRLETLE